jgi:hypothetical protein
MWVLAVGAWEPGPDVFYRNNGNGTLTDITKEAGLDKNIGACLHAGFFDYDEDGFIDLYLFNDDRVLIYHNEKGKKFTDVSEKLGKPLQDFSWSGGCADVDNDGYMDIFAMQWSGEVHLFHNNGNGTFTDVARESGLTDWFSAANLLFGKR